MNWLGLLLVLQRHSVHLECKHHHSLYFVYVCTNILCVQAILHVSICACLGLCVVAAKLVEQSFFLNPLLSN